MSLHVNEFFATHKNKVVWLEGDGNYTRVHMVEGYPKSLPYTLKVLNEKLPDFVRVHKSSLVNPIHAQKLKATGYREYSVNLSNGVTLSVSLHRLRKAAKLMNLAIP